MDDYRIGIVLRPIRAHRIESKSAAINDDDPRHNKKHE